jgi:microcystin-dependent protein
MITQQVKSDNENDLFRDPAGNPENTSFIRRTDMFDRLVKFMALVGAAAMILLLIAASASIKIIGENVEVTGNLKVQGVDYAHVPVGTVVAFLGTTAPAGWVICDGRDISGSEYAGLRAYLTANGLVHQNKAPDLRGRFIAGYSNGDSDYSPLGKTGGEEMHKLTIAEMPLHNHDMYTRNVDNIQDSNDYIAGTDTGGNSANHGTGNAGGDQPHENRPPYYSLTYILKY